MDCRRPHNGRQQNSENRRSHCYRCDGENRWTARTAGVEDPYCARTGVSQTGGRNLYPTRPAPSPDGVSSFTARVGRTLDLGRKAGPEYERPIAVYQRWRIRRSADASPRRCRKRVSSPGLTAFDGCAENKAHARYPIGGGVRECPADPSGARYRRAQPLVSGSTYAGPVSGGAATVRSGRCFGKSPDPHSLRQRSVTARSTRRRVDGVAVRCDRPTGSTVYAATPWANTDRSLRTLDFKLLANF